MERQRTFAALIRSTLRNSELGIEAQLSAEADELEALACELEDDALALDPASAVACARLLTDVERSPLLNPALPPELLCSHLRQIRSGFRRRELAA